MTNKFGSLIGAFVFVSAVAAHAADPEQPCIKIGFIAHKFDVQSNDVQTETSGTDAFNDVRIDWDNCAQSHCFGAWSDTLSIDDYDVQARITVLSSPAYDEVGMPNDDLPITYMARLDLRTVDDNDGASAMVILNADATLDNTFMLEGPTTQTSPLYGSVLSIAKCGSDTSGLQFE